MRNLQLAFRSLKKDGISATINLAGLIIGITSCLLIFSFVKYELSFDDFHQKKDRIYRVNYDVLMGGNQSVSPSVPVFVGPVLKTKFPEVEDATRFLPEYTDRTIRHGDKLFDEPGFAYADPNFFHTFDFKPVSGNLQTALSKPNTLVITKSIAEKYFGNADPIGQSISFDNQKQFMIGAVMEDVPANSHFRFDMLTSFYSIQGFDSTELQEEWNNPNYATFLVLKPGTNAAALTKKIDNWVNPPGNTQQASANSLHLPLQALKEAHFDIKSYNYKNFLSTTDIKYVRIFIVIAMMVLLIGCANYINLSTARASVRAKEVGVRKTIGASFSQLLFQFLAESFLLTCFAVIVSTVLVYALMPHLNNLLGKQIPFRLLEKSFLPWIIGGTILLSMLAGFYPALVLTRFKPVETLKGDVTKIGSSGVSVRKSLVVFQFTISIALILGTIIVQSQLRYMQSTRLGLDKEHVLLIQGNKDVYRHFSTFADDIRKITGVENASLTWRSPFQTVIGNGFSIKAHPENNEDWNVVGGIAGDQYYLSTLGITLLTGRNFDPSKIKGDSTINEFIVNEAFLRNYQLKPAEVLGKEVVLGISGPGTIVGVMKDFHTGSMHEIIQPVVLFNTPRWLGSVLVRIGPGKLTSVMKGLEKIWRKTAPDRPFNYSFLNEEYDALYRTEQRLGSLMSLFSGLAILVTCLGLLGLMAFMVAQRTKEIGIRKILGASVINIAGLLSKDFLKLVGIAILVASPLAWYFMHGWLQNFAYKIHIHWLIFLVTGIAALFIALITISFQVIKVARANPVRSLRAE